MLQTDQLPNWIIVLNALLTPTIAIAVVAVGIWQARVNANRLRLELFDRRMKIFESLRQLITSIVASRYPDDQALADFRKGIDGANFLFGKDIEEYLKKWWTHAVTLNTAHHALNDGIQGTEKERWLDEQKNAFRWCVPESEKFSKPFEKYMILKSEFRT